MLRFLAIVFDLERANQLNLLPDKDLVDLCPPYRTIPSNEEPLYLFSHTPRKEAKLTLTKR
ncbi:MAG: hypothetical protein EWV81_05070 [Microcystis aeruginosa Ma_SC_T_19800800_S464]|uniref:Uncharacterized protein n=1 Tax=Microcystis aeruginosa Ma_SC_T_19800800_S464 TaxID=2486257 RepID=A0A552E270_MICAE|nr:MAG: hypothetical protein EWV81_05070 [Microcystis aeruginosa Ma_SC_T_19800800_S464]